MSNEKETEEGPRGFAVVLQQIDEGSIHARASSELQQLLAALDAYSKNYRTAAKGSMTLTLNFDVEEGVVNVQAKVDTKSPKPKGAKSMFWLTAGKNLSVENPRQQKLPLRDVSTPTTRDVGAVDTQPARGI